ncbi:TonB-dependent receptor [uncultured Bacteroides sp.]|uniref:SusC/RagA family TonB-linked outer membrane protein n=1 Tax=uncultured Bacteroides sp. TaxID=162156 RepID=UPI0025D7388F|nr:TonB-dependent receptor [uncultured Bacteroides sp.]
MKRFILLFISLALFTFHSAFAQNFVVKGTVVSHEDNEPLIGVTILQEGTTNGVVTDMDGNYSLEVKGASNATLVFSYIGYAAQSHKVNASTGVLNVSLKSDAELIDEVVVVAYGVRKKGTIAGSVSTVKSEKLENVPTASFDQALQGQTPGLTVISNSGEPSVAATFQIRGTNSINSGTTPLFILDGVPIESSSFNAISPSDIESISVLKDASSTSIYGARAANGVVVITTKRGRKTDGAKVTFRGQWGFSQLAGNNWDLMNTAERIKYEKEIGLDLGEDYYNKIKNIDVNWMDAVYNNNAPSQSYDLSVNGATDKTNYYVSGSFFDQDGITIGSAFRRYNLRANVENRAKEWLKLGTSTLLAYEDVEQAEDGEYALYAPISASHFMLPYWNPYNEDGSLASQNGGEWKGSGQNPIEWMQNNPVKHKTYKVISSLFAEVTPIENLTIRSQFGIDYSHATSFMQSFPSYIINNESGTAGRASSDGLTLTVTNTANYRFNLDDTHDFNFMIGQEGVNYHYETFQAVTEGQKNDALTNMASGSFASSWSDNTSDYGFLSFFGRGEYNYKNKYYADFSVRADASSRFGEGNRWAGFWSVGLMWDMRREDFFKQYDWLTNAQLTFSTGTSGNSSIPNYEHLALVTGGSNYMGETGISPNQRGNKDLTWEKLWTTNIGLRLGFFNRLNFTAEFYNKLTTDMLMQVPVSYADGGYGAYWDNVGAMVNRGVELSLDADIIKTKDFTWNVFANASYNKNKLTELYNGIDEYVDSNVTMYSVGHTVTGFYMVRYAGVNPANGDALWYTKDGKITNEFSEEDRVLIEGKSFVAPWQGGFGTNLSWKGLMLSAQFSWMADRWVYNNDRLMDESNGLYTSYNQSRRLLYDRWKKPGDVTDIPRHGVTPQFDTHYLENASFLRLKNLMLSYNIPGKALAKTRFFDGARVFVQGQNLLTFTGFTGIDPEVSANIYRAQYPMTRQFTLGVELNF